jgi:hypothetical protein
MLPPRFALFFPVLLLAGCAWGDRVRSISTAANNTAVVERDADGTVAMRSYQKHLVTVLWRGERFAGHTLAMPAFRVIVANGGDQPIKLNLTDVTASSGGKRVAVLDPSGLKDRLDAEQPGPTHAPRPGSGYEPFSAPKFKVPAWILEEALRSQVIRPGDVGGGRIMLESEDILSDFPLKVVVTVAGEQHEFLFEVH